MLDGGVGFRALIGFIGFRVLMAFSGKRAGVQQGPRPERRPVGAAGQGGTNARFSCPSTIGIAPASLEVLK